MKEELKKAYEQGQSYKKAFKEKNKYYAGWERQILKKMEFKEMDSVMDLLLQATSDLSIVPPDIFIHYYEKTDFFKVANMFMLGFQSI